MSNYGFDYLNKRVLVLEARTRVSWAEGYPDIDQLFLDITKKMEKGGDGVIGHTQRRSTTRALRYFLLMLTEIDEQSFDSNNDGEVSDSEAGSSVAKIAARLIGAPPEKWRNYYRDVKDDDKVMRLALRNVISGEGMGHTPDEKAQNANFIRRYRQYMLSPEFREKVSNEESILNYARTNRMATPQQIIPGLRRETKMGMPEHKIDEILINSSDLVRTIKRQQLAEKKRLIPQYGGTIAPQIEEEGTNQFIDDLYQALDAIDNITSLKNEMQALFKGQEISDEDFQQLAQGSDFSPQELEAIYDDKTVMRSVNQFLKNSEKIGIDFENFEADLAKAARSNPQVGGIIGAYLRELNALRTETEKYRNYDLAKQSKEYRGYNKQILDMILTDPEDRAKFDAFYKLEQRQRQIQLEDLRNEILSLKGIATDFIPRGTKAAIARGFKKFQEKRPEMGTPAPKKVSTKMAPARKPKEDEEMFESYDVMDYMTEQVTKDQRTHPRGEFKDRGFVKARNYSEWLWLNQNK